MRSFISTDNNTSKSDTWLTPLNIIESLGNDFDLDPCGFEFHKTAKLIYELPVCGLTSAWSGKVFLNPPYSNIKIWLDKLSVHGYGTALVFNRADTCVMQDHFTKASSVFFLSGRISFLKKDLTRMSNAGTGSILLSYGYTPDYSKLKGWKAK